MFLKLGWVSTEGICNAADAAATPPMPAARVRRAPLDEWPGATRRTTDSAPLAPSLHLAHPSIAGRYSMGMECRTAPA